MKPGDLRRFKDGLRSSAFAGGVAGRPFMVLEVRYWCDCPEWVQILEDGESLWTAAALIRPIDG